MPEVFSSAVGPGDARPSRPARSADRATAPAAARSGRDGGHSHAIPRARERDGQNGLIPDVPLAGSGLTRPQDADRPAGPPPPPRAAHLTRPAEVTW
jgi:hypothetical protein